MKMPVELSPSSQAVRRPGVLDDAVELGEVLGLEARDRLLQQPALELEPEGEQVQAPEPTQLAEQAQETGSASEMESEQEEEQAPESEQMPEQGREQDEQTAA